MRALESFPISIPEHLTARKPIIQKSMQGEFIKEWDGAVSINKNLKINSGSITDVCSGKRKSAGGFKFEYKEGN